MNPDIEKCSDLEKDAIGKAVNFLNEYIPSDCMMEAEDKLAELTATFEKVGRAGASEEFKQLIKKMGELRTELGELV